MRCALRRRYRSRGANTPFLGSIVEEGGTYRSRHVRTGRVVFGGFAKSLREDDVVERALRTEEFVEHFFVGHRVAYDVLDGAMPEGLRRVTDDGPATVAQPRSVGEARLVVHS